MKTLKYFHFVTIVKFPLHHFLIQSHHYKNRQIYPNQFIHLFVRLRICFSSYSSPSLNHSFSYLS